MADTPNPTTPGARFPYAAAVFCAACLAAAVWTFMIFSWARDVDWNDFQFEGDPVNHRLVGRYVRLRRPAEGEWSRYGHGGDRLAAILDHLCGKISAGEEAVWVPVKGLPEDASPAVVQGRVIAEHGMGSVSVRFLGIDAAASRWTGASVAGLVVGTMGVLIFALHLRRWLRVSRLGGEGASRAEEESTA